MLIFLISSNNSRRNLLTAFFYSLHEEAISIISDQRKETVAIFGINDGKKLMLISTSRSHEMFCSRNGCAFSFPYLKNPFNLSSDIFISTRCLLDIYKDFFAFRDLESIS